MRKLASIQTITDIAPIEGRDRIVLATVEGWHVIVTTDFHIGDRVVFCEIDSVMPEKPEFEFLRPKKFHIKTMRMAGVTSQGICFPLDILPEEYRDCEIGEDVTDIIGVKQYEPTMDKEPDNAGFKQKNSKKYPQFLMRFAWFRKLVLPKPRKGGFPSFISKTDEERCLDGNTKILTDNGLIRIADIVNKKMDVKVASVDDDGYVEYSDITSYQKYEADKDLIKLSFPFRPYCDRQNSIICTKDHKLLTNDGYKRADQLAVGDYVSYAVDAYRYDIVQYVYGMLLGDGCVHLDKRSATQNLRISVTHGEDQLEYLQCKRRVFGEDHSTVHECKSGYSDKKVYRLSVDQDYTITKALYDDKAIDGNGRLVITKEFCKRISPVSLAVWYLDDGVCRHLNNEVYSNNTSGTPAIELSTNSFSKDEVLLLSNRLNDFYIDNTIRTINRNRKTYYSIYITTNGTKNFMNIISPFVPECMRYKLIDKFRSAPYILDGAFGGKVGRIIYDNIMSVEHIKLSKFSNHRFVYDLEIAPYHNFIANGIINHNCQNMPWIVNDKREWIATEKIDGQSGTFALVRHKGLFRDKFEYIVCSRNMRLAHPDGSSYWCVSDRYQIENALRNMIGDRDWIAIQGECIAPKVQKNKYGVKEPDLYVFNLIYPSGRVDSLTAKSICEQHGFNFVPIVQVGYVLPDTVDEILAYADGQSQLADTMREGIVFRSMDGKQSFKAVSNQFLLKWSE